MEKRNSHNNSSFKPKEPEIKDYIVEDYIKKHVNIESFCNVKHITKYKNEDIDYLITLKNKRKVRVKVEISSDVYDTQNILYKVNAFAGNNFLNYIETTKADFLFYYFSKIEELVILNLSDLKKWICKNKNRLKIKRVNHKKSRGMDSCSQEFIMLPKNLLKIQIQSYKSERVKIHNFKNSLEMGKKGEIIITDFLKEYPGVVEVYGVEHIKKYQEEDVDLLVLFKDKKKRKIEIKTDGYMTGNIFYETVSSIEGNTVGCMEKTKADFLFYYFPRSEELYIINMRAYRKWFSENKEKFTQKIITNKCRDNKNVYHSEGFLIPKSFLESNFKAYKKHILKFDEKVLNKHSA